MEILKNKQEMARLHEYRCQSDKFAECYVEIPGNETKSGNPVILDW